MTAAALAGLLLGGVLAGLAWAGGRDWLDNPQLQRSNYAGRSVPVSGGIVLVAALVGVAAIWVVVAMLAGDAAIGDPARGDGAVSPIGGTDLWRSDAEALTEGGSNWRATALLLAAVAVPVVALSAGFGLLGFLDDVLGGGGQGDAPVDKGFRGHLRALARGRVTTGLLKLVGGASVALVVAAWGTSLQGGALAEALDAPAWEGRDAWRVLVDAAAIALAANLANLFDLAPGRLLKIALVCGAGILAWGWGGLAAPVVAPALGAGAALLPLDLRERTMLGDTGANVLGAVLAFVLLRTLGDFGAVVLVVVLLAMNALSEVVSYSKVIGSVQPLRWADGLGRRGA